MVQMVCVEDKSENENLIWQVKWEADSEISEEIEIDGLKEFPMMFMNTKHIYSEIKTGNLTLVLI